MQRNLLLAAFVTASLGTFAQLAPQQKAPLRDHLQEVNAEWRAHADLLKDGDHLVSFADEAERIATHLHLVQERLNNTVPEGLSADQAHNRQERLVELEHYADRGLFPQNHVLPYRNPIFIDPHNTACAVGQLIIESGNAALAERISAEKNNAYIREMNLPEIATWANTNGFTGDELAWIQPGYPPSYPWATLGEGTDGEVDELLALSNGDLILAGSFAQAGGNDAIRVARYDGSTYSAMPGLPEGTVNASVEFNGDIYLGGAFNGGTADLAMWNGTTWITEAVFSSKYGEVTALHVHNGALHAAGASSGFAGITHDVRRRTGNTWNSVGQPLNGTIHTLETFDGTLVCGGDFTGIPFSGNNDILHVAGLNGNAWEQLGDGLNGGVRDLLVLNDSLYAGGDLLSEVMVYFGLSRIGAGATEWEPLMPNLTNYIFSPVDATMRIFSMQDRDGRIYLAGDMFVSDLMVQGTGLAVFNGTADDVDPMCEFLGPVFDVALIEGSQLVIGGISQPYANIASLDLTTGIGEQVTPLTFAVTPNPVTDMVTLQLPAALGPNARVRIIDASGRTVATPAQRQADVVRLNTQSLAAGTYQIEARDGDQIAIGRFVKE